MNHRILTDAMMLSFRSHLMAEEKSSATVEKYIRDIQTFREYSRGKEIQKELAMDYKEYLLKMGYAVSSVNSMIASLNSFFDHSGWTDCKVKCLKQQKKIYCPEDKELTKDEYFRLLEASGENSRLQLIMQTICSTGIRVSELQFFTVEAVNRGEVLVNCKGKLRTILIPAKLRKKLLKYADDNGRLSGAIFVNGKGKALNRSYIWMMMKRLCKKADVNPDKVFPHNLRKLFARTFYSIEKDIAKLADILGHSSIDTTRIYIMSSGYEHRRKIERLQLVI